MYVAYKLIVIKNAEFSTARHTAFRLCLFSDGKPINSLNGDTYLDKWRKKLDINQYSVFRQNIAEPEANNKIKPWNSV